VIAGYVTSRRLAQVVLTDPRDISDHEGATAEGKMSMRTKGFLQIIAATCLMAPVAVGCGDQRSPGTLPVTAVNPPAMPMPVVGQAMVAGRVVGVDGRGIAGATILIAETDATTTSDADGAYQLSVPSDSTVTLVATGAGLASTFRESVIVASQAVVTGFDFLLLLPDKVTAINALGVPGQEATRGVMAVRLHSMDPACLTEGAEVSVWPPLATTVVYSRPNPSGTFDEPDPDLTAVLPGARIDLWMVGTVPPGNGLVISVHKAGCSLLNQSPSIGGVVFSGQRHVLSQSITEADLFLGRSQ
jgi:Carboxypeptidase regulatory-like domain